MAATWQTISGGETHYVQVTNQSVLVGSHGDSEMSDSAGGVFHKNFLEGSYQGIVQSQFGSEVLAEVLQEVRSHPPTKESQEELEIENRRKQFLENLPLNPALENLEISLQTKNGRHNHGNAGAGWTRVRGGKGELTICRTSGSISYPQEGTEYPVELKGFSCSAVGLNDHYYVIHTWHFAEIGPKGEILFDTENLADSVFGCGLRLDATFESNGLIALKCASTTFYGLLEYQTGLGFTSRWEKSEHRLSCRESPPRRPDMGLRLRRLWKSLFSAR